LAQVRPSIAQFVQQGKLFARDKFENKKACQIHPEGINGIRQSENSKQMWDYAHNKHWDKTGRAGSPMPAKSVG
jgi:hypothetical protein